MKEITEHQDLIRTIIWKIAGTQVCKADIEDIASDVNLALLEESGSRSLKGYDPTRGTTVSTFIGMVAKSITLDYFRDRQRQMSRSVTLDDAGEFAGGSGHDGGYQVPDQTEDALTMMVRREQREQLADAIENLSDDDKALLQSCLSDEEGYAERIAAERGVKPVAVRVRKSRLVDGLRTRLNKGEN